MLGSSCSQTDVFSLAKSVSAVIDNYTLYELELSLSKGKPVTPDIYGSRPKSLRPRRPNRSR